MKQELEKLKELFHELDVIKYGNFKLTSGRESNYKIDAEIILQNKQGIDLIGKLGSEKLSELENLNNSNYEIACVYKGGFLFGNIVAQKRNQDILSINPKKNIWSGKIYLNTPYVIFEDITTTGGSVLKSIDIMKELDLKPTITICIVDRQEGAKENLEKRGVKLYSFLTKKDLGIL